MAYAVAYPFGIIGIILTTLLIKKVFALDPRTDGKLLGKQLLVWTTEGWNTSIWR